MIQNNVTSASAGLWQADGFAPVLFNFAINKVIKSWMQGTTQQGTTLHKKVPYGKETKRLKRRIKN